jgi:hypothetical protein
VCFLGGSFLLGVTEGNRKEVDWKKLDSRDKVDMIVGKGIIEGCMRTYLDTPTCVLSPCPQSAWTRLPSVDWPRKSPCGDCTLMIWLEKRIGTSSPMCMSLPNMEIFLADMK